MERLRCAHLFELGVNFCLLLENSMSLLAGQTPWTGWCSLYGPHEGLCLLLENSYHLWLDECWLVEFGVELD